MNILSHDGLPFTEVVLSHKGKSLRLTHFLIDTGSASTLISIEAAVYLDLEAKPNDIARTVRGVGGVESVYDKCIDNIQLGAKWMDGFKIEVSDMNYGFEMDGILRYDFMAGSGVVIDFKKMTIE